MQRLRKASLVLQLPLFAAALSLLVGLAIVWLATTSSSFLQMTRERAYGGDLAQQVAAAVSDSLQRGDLLSVRASLQGFVDSSLASAIRINDVEGLPIGQAGEVAALRQERFRAAIKIGEDTAGEVQLSLDRDELAAGQQRLLFSLLALAVALSLLVFVLARFLALRLATGLRALHSQLLLPDSQADATVNEVAMLRHAVEQLPVDMLRGHAAVPAAATDFRDAVVLFVHLESLARYVNTLSESNLHRYTRRLQQLLQAAAQCYRGQLQVTRQFGLLVTFGEQRNAGSEALRAASCARLIARVTEALEERTSLSLNVAMALGHCELSSAEEDDMYPALYLQGSIDELRASCLALEDFPTVLVTASALEDSQLAAVAELRNWSGPRETAAIPGNSEFQELGSLSQEQETLLAHQAELIVERIKPVRRDAS
jgi:hypothetical protein